MRIVVDSHGWLYQVCNPQEKAEGVVAFGPTGAARPCDVHIRDVYGVTIYQDSDGWTTITLAT